MMLTVRHELQTVLVNKPSEADDVVDSDVYSVVEEPAYSLAGDHDEAVAKAFGLS